VSREYFYTEGVSLTRSKTLYSCLVDDPPEYFSDLAVEPTADLKHSITVSDFDKFKFKVCDGEKCWNLKYEREIYMETKQGTLLFRVVTSEGKEWGGAEIEYDVGEETVDEREMLFLQKSSSSNNSGKGYIRYRSLDS
jgi:hypothetical protein